MLKIGVIKNFQGEATAEHECIERIRLAGSQIGVDVRILDVEGTPLDGRPLADTSELTFAISIHFEAPKLFDTFVYHALWNPLEFLVGLGWPYRQACSNVLSYDSYLSCASDWADAHARLLLRGQSRPGLATQTQGAPAEIEFPHLFHSLAEPILAPRSTKRRFFYCGINWDLLCGRKHRFHRILKALDAAGESDFYGPERLKGGVRPWKGFACYRGSVPFDGRTLIHRAADAGLVLAFSSDDHKDSGLMSNRLFEACAAGALIVTDENRWTRRFFGDSVFHVDLREGDDPVTRRLFEISDWANTHPEEAAEMARASQKIFLERFELKGLLQSLIGSHSGRVGNLALLPCPSAPETHLIIIQARSEVDFTALLRSMRVNLESLSEISIFKSRADRSPSWTELAGSIASLGFQGRINFHAIALDPRTGPWMEVASILPEVLKEGLGSNYSFLPTDEEIFTGHLKQLGASLNQSPFLSLACSGVSYLLRRSRQDPLRSKDFQNEPSFRPEDWMRAPRASLAKYLFRKADGLTEPALFGIYGRFWGNAVYLRALNSGTACALPCTSVRVHYEHSDSERDCHFRYTELQADDLSHLSIRDYSDAMALVNAKPTRRGDRVEYSGLDLLMKFGKRRLPLPFKEWLVRKFNFLRLF